MNKKTTKRISLEKGFVNPFADPEYFNKITYDEFFEEVKKELEDYTVRALPAEHLKPIDDPNDEDALTERLKVLVPYYPGLWESEHPQARLLVKHFGKLLNIALRGVDSKERKKAEHIIKDITTTKPSDFKNTKKYIPPLLSVRELYACVHEITNFLKTKYIAEFGNEPLSTENIHDNDTLTRLSKADSRLVALAQNGDITALINKPATLTKRLIARFFGFTLGGLNQAMKAENSHHSSRQ